MLDDRRWYSWADSFLFDDVLNQNDLYNLKEERKSQPSKERPAKKRHIKQHKKNQEARIIKLKVKPAAPSPFKVKIEVKKLANEKYEFVKVIWEANNASHSLSFEETPAVGNKDWVGLLTWAERQAKLDHYRWKKARWSWNRKINYHSRKRVADTRPRFKGRFISVSQAGSLIEQY